VSKCATVGAAAARTMQRGPRMPKEAAGRPRSHVAQSVGATATDTAERRVFAGDRVTLFVAHEMTERRCGCVNLRQPNAPVEPERIEDGDSGDSSMPSLPFLHEAIVTPEYEDINGHMNISHYMGMHDGAAMPFLATLDRDETYVSQRLRGILDLEHHLFYLAEVHAGDVIAVHSRILARSEKAVHGMVVPAQSHANAWRTRSTGSPSTSTSTPVAPSPSAPRSRKRSTARSSTAAPPARPYGRSVRRPVVM